MLLLLLFFTPNAYINFTFLCLEKQLHHIHEKNLKTLQCRPRSLNSWSLRKYQNIYQLNKKKHFGKYKFIIDNFLLTGNFEYLRHTFSWYTPEFLEKKLIKSNLVQLFSVCWKYQCVFYKYQVQRKIHTSVDGSP